jgi:hypothetical protein
MRAAVSTLLVACLLAGCATVHGPRDIEEVRPGEPTLYDWARVLELEPASAIAVSTRQSRALERVFVAADDSRVVVLNVTSPTLSPSSIRTLRSLAAGYPNALASIATSGGLMQDDVRVGADGVFVANRRVAAVEEIVETIARDEVIEIDGPVVARGSAIGATFGGWIGFAAGVIPGLGGAPAAAAWPIVIGSVVLGAYLGHRWTSHTTDGIVYKAR